MQLVKKALETVKTNAFLRHNLVFFVGSMAVAFLNYLYYPVMGRLLSNAAFGEVQVIVSSFMQLTTILGVVSLVAIGILINEPNKKVAAATVAQLEKLMLIFGFVVLLAVILTSGMLQSALKFSTVWPFIAIGIVFVVTIPLTFRNAHLRAVKDFSGASMVGALGSIVKLLASVLFVLMSLYVLGAVMGILVSQLVALGFAIYRLKKNGHLQRESVKDSASRFDFSLIKPQLPYAGFVLIISLITTLQISVDVTIVKYFFTPDEAGNYAAIATIARIIFFLTGSIVAVLLSSISMKNEDAENKKLLVRSLAMVSGLGGLTSIFFSIFPVFVVHLLLGSRYDAYVHLLPLLSLTIFVGSLVTLFTTYHIALHSYRILPIVIIGAITTFVMTLVHHATLEEVIVNMLVGSAIMLIGIVVYTFKRSLFPVR